MCLKAKEENFLMARWGGDNRLKTEQGTHGDELSYSDTVSHSTVRKYSILISLPHSLMALQARLSNYHKCFRNH